MEHRGNLMSICFETPRGVSTPNRVSPAPPEGWRKNGNKSIMSNDRTLPIDFTHTGRDGKTTTFVFERFLGRGGQGEVYKYTAENKSIAVKVIDKDAKHSSDLKGWEAIGDQSCGTVDVLGHVEGRNGENYVTYIICEYLETVLSDEDLLAKLRKDPLKMKYVLHSIMDSVVCLIEKGVFYTDVKMDNVMVNLSTDQPTVKLIDLGSAMPKNLANQWAPACTYYYPNKPFPLILGGNGDTKADEFMVKYQVFLTYASVMNERLQIFIDQNLVVTNFLRKPEASPGGMKRVHAFVDVMKVLENQIDDSIETHTRLINRYGSTWREKELEKSKTLVELYKYIKHGLKDCINASELSRNQNPTAPTRPPLLCENKYNEQQSEGPKRKLFSTLGDAS